MSSVCVSRRKNLPSPDAMGSSLTGNSLLPKTIQILLFSATFPDNVHRFAQQFAPKANEIKLRHTELTVKGISQMYMDCPDEGKKYDVLCKLYGLMTIGSSVIFVRVSSRWQENVYHPLSDQQI